MLGNDGDKHAKLVAVHNGVGEVRSDVSISRWHRELRAHFVFRSDRGR